MRTSSLACLLQVARSSRETRPDGFESAITNLMNGTTMQQSRPPNDKSTALPVGTVAPDFTLKSAPNETVTLSDFRGHPVILFFTLLIGVQSAEIRRRL